MSSIAKKLLIKLIHPGHIWQMIKLSRQKNRKSTALANMQLKLYAEILPGDFLHYGYFDDPSILPEEMSLRDIQQAQLRYAELLIEQIKDHTSPVLDAGCGQGGLLNLLHQQNLNPTGLTPDAYQIQYLKEKYTDIPALQAKFEDMPVASYPAHFGTVIHSESLQYMDLDQAIAVVNKVLKPEGRWIVCDYFRIGEAREKSGLRQEIFREKLAANGYKIISERDITENVCPTLAYVHLWGDKIGMPVFKFGVEKLKSKRPATHYFLTDVIEKVKKSFSKNLDVVDPQIFSSVKRYVLFVIEHA